MLTYKEMSVDKAEHIRHIDRSEIIEKMYKYEDGELKEEQTGYECSNWGENDYLEMISRYKNELTNGGTAFGAYDGEKLVGFGVLGYKFRGKEEDQLQLDLMYVTRKYRRKGIGKKLMGLLSEAAKKKGAKYLYISSTETESAVNFYTSLGSRLTEKVDKELFGKEPLDIHMVKKLDIL